MQCLQGYVNNETRPSLVDTLSNQKVTFLNYPVIVCSDFGQFYGTEVAKPGDPTTLPGGTSPFIRRYSTI
jgi:hypothetical protein